MRLALLFAALCLFAASCVHAQSATDIPAPKPEPYQVRIGVVIMVQDPVIAEQKFVKVTEMIDSIMEVCHEENDASAAFLGCVQNEITVNQQLGTFGAQVNFVFPDTSPASFMPAPPKVQ